MIASCSTVGTVDRGCFGPVRRSATEQRFLHFRHGLRVDSMPPSQRPQALLTILYRSTDRLCPSDA
jgi:hypothetical protein